MSLHEYNSLEISDKINQELKRLSERNECFQAALRMPKGFPDQPESVNAIKDLHAGLFENLVDVYNYKGDAPLNNSELYEHVKNRLDDLYSLNECYQAFGAIREAVNIQSKYRIEEEICINKHKQMLEFLKTI